MPKDEEIKANDEELETILGEERKETELNDESKTIVEEAIEEAGSESEKDKGDEDKNPQDVTSADKPQKAKGDWRTQLPAELREGIDIDKYKSISEYIKALREEAENARKPEPEKDELWTELSKELKIDGESSDTVGRDTFKALKDSGLTTKQAKEVYTSMQDAIAKYAESKKAEIKNDMLSFQESIAGKDKDKIQALKGTLKRGMMIVCKNNPDLYDKGIKDGAFLHPAVANLLYMIGLDNKEALSPEDSKKPMADTVTKDNPFGLI